MDWIEKKKQNLKHQTSKPIKATKILINWAICLVDKCMWEETDLYILRKTARMWYKSTDEKKGIKKNKLFIYFRPFKTSRHLYLRLHMVNGLIFRREKKEMKV